MADIQIFKPSAKNELSANGMVRPCSNFTRDMLGAKPLLRKSVISSELPQRGPSTRCLRKNRATLALKSR
jgi:hypothetical protein